MAAGDTTECGNAPEEDKDEEVKVGGEADMGVPALEARSPSDDPPQETQDPRTWKWAVIFLCFYGFMGSIKPGEPFITPYLLSHEKNFSRVEVTNEITPVLTYSYMAVLVPAFLLTDLLRYKPVLIVQGVSQVVIWVILLLGSTVLQMQFMEFFYGVTMACRVAYSSYIFSLVSPALYQRVAGYSRSSVLLGVFTSSVLGQLCYSVGGVSFRTLNAISLGFVILGMLLSLILPWPKRSLFFNRTKQQEQRERTATAAKTELDKMNPAAGVASSGRAWTDSVFVQMLLELKNVLKSPNLRLWCLWWVLNSTGYYLVLFNVHILWNSIYTENVYNGGVDAASTLLSAVASFTAGYVKIRWNVWSELVIGVITAVHAALLLLMGTTSNIWVCYLSYVLFRGFYQFLVPIATFQIASSLTKELCALVFGINTFLGTVLKSIFTLIVIDKRGMGLNVEDQFWVYFIYFSLLTVVYLSCGAAVVSRHCRSQRRGGGGADEQAAPPTELGQVEANSEAQPLSNGVKA